MPTIDILAQAGRLIANKGMAQDGTQILNQDLINDGGRKEVIAVRADLLRGLVYSRPIELKKKMQFQPIKGGNQ